MADTKDLLQPKVKTKRYSGKYCAAYGCNEFYGERAKQQGITFHSFPFSNPDIVKKWECVMHRKEYKASIHSRVCSNHFVPDSLDRTGLRVRLKTGAVPTIFQLHDHPRHIQHRESLAKRNGLELTAQKMCKPTTLSSVEHSSAPVLELSCEQIESGHSSNGTYVVSVESGATSNLTTPQSKLRIENGHSANGTNVMSVGSRANSNLTTPPFKLRIENGHSANGTNVVSVGLGATRNLTTPPFKLRTCNGHDYSLPDPKELKHKLRMMEFALAQYKQKIKMLKQKNRRLELRLKSQK